MGLALTLRAALALVLGLALLIGLPGQAGVAEANFGRDGRTQLKLGAAPEQVIGYGDSEALILIGNSQFAGKAGIARIDAEGALDRSFGARGFVSIPWTAVAVQADGKILVLHTSGSPLAGPTDPTVTRLLPNGAVDRRFGSNGTRTVDLGRDYDRGSAILVAAGGRILIAGSSATAFVDKLRIGLDDIQVLARLRPGGALDRSFAIDGRQFLDLRGEVGSMARAPRGAVVVKSRVGYFREGFSLMRVRRGGAIDWSFGDSGQVRFAESRSASGEETLEAVDQLHVLPNGRIVLAGSSPLGVADGRVFTVRLRPNGRLDRSYGNGGFAKLGVRGVSASPGGFTVRRDGSVLVAAELRQPGGTGSELAALMFDNRGKRERRFGRGGRMTFRFPEPPGADAALPSAVAALLVSRDRAIVAGRTFGLPASTRTLLAEVSLPPLRVR